ncbi:hypothetical protein BH10PSE18_BH10PSE18_16970 [soil metagenome]
MRCAKLAKIIGVLLLGATLYGCSAIKLAYNNLPEFTYWWLDGYLDFDGAQTPRVKEQLAQLLAWHRRNELPKLVSLVQKAEQMAPNDVTPTQVCAFTDNVRMRLLTVAQQASQPGAELALSLGTAQLQQLERKYTKINADYASDWLERSPARQHEKRYDEFLERNEDFYGTLDASQRRLLRQLTDRSIFDPRRVDAERRQRQQEALGLLRGFSNSAMPASEVRAAIDAYAQRIADPPPGAWRDYQQALLQEGCGNVAALHNATRPEQREKAVRRLRAYEQDLRDLMATP